MNEIKKTGFLIGLLFILTTSVSMQGTIRKIEEAPLQKNSPIVLVGRELRDKSFSAEERVWGDQDWLKHLAFEVRNVSSKDIIFFEIELLIRKQDQMPAAVGFRIEFGAPMVPDGDTPEKAAKRKVLEAGEIVKARISDSEFSFWTRELEKYGVNDVERVTLTIRTVEFDDGTRWSMGGEWKRDADKKRWVPKNGPSEETGSRLPSWFASFVPLPTITNLCGNTVTMIPAFSRNFFLPARPPTVECGYDARTVVTGMATEPRATTLIKKEAGPAFLR